MILEMAIAMSMAAAQPDAAKRDDEARSPASIFATETGRIAGNAEFCEIDPELVEEFLSIAEARIIALASDDVDLAVSRFEFSNSQSRAAITEPDGGCDNFSIYFAAQKNRISK